MLVRKQDGAFLYATTDLATIRYRMDTWQPDAILYVVDHRQSLHFEQLFATARLMGYRSRSSCTREVRHGAGRGRPAVQDPRPATRWAWKACWTRRYAGPRRSWPTTTTPSPTGRNCRPSSAPAVAETVGIAALKYADLSQNRTSDYEFSYDKMLAMNGNTATYMQYAYARVRQHLRQGERGRRGAAPLRRCRSCWKRPPSGRWPWNCSASARPWT